MIRKLNLYIKIACFAMGFMLLSCANDEVEEPEKREAEKTIFMYLPWTVDLTNFFYQNIRDMETSICDMGGLAGNRLIVFMSTSKSEASMYEIEYADGRCIHTPIASYRNYPFTTEEGLTSLLQDLKRYAPARRYSMIVGSHGMGWLPVNAARASYSRERFHYEYAGGLPTRYFGGTTAEYQTDISTLANAIGNAGMKMDYILFDDCYMATIEVAYELKDAADYLIASTCEVMAYGMPYATMGKYLIGEPDYGAVCDEFYRFYSNSYGTLSVTDCSRLDEVAAMMRYINQNYSLDEAAIASLQKLDGYSPTIFFDFGDYVNKMLAANDADQILIDEFNRRLSAAVPYRVNTAKYYTKSTGPLPIHTYSGITTSDPSISPKAVDKVSTKWYSVSH